MTSGAWPSGPHNVLSIPAIEKSPRIAVFKRFSGVFPVQPGRCPPRRAAADVRPPVASGHKKKTPTAVDAFALNENENVRAFPALIMPIPVDIRGFSSTSPASPGLSRFLNYPVPLQPPGGSASLSVIPNQSSTKKSSAYLRDQGYTVKAFNLVPPAASDSWNCLSEIEGQELMSHMRGILTARLGSGIDFIVKGHENKSRSVAASRKGAMYRKCQSFYLDKDERGEPMIYEARVVAVAEKVVRVEVFGVECAILARGLSRAWAGDAAGHCHVGDRILVRVQKITGTTVEDLSISADVRSTSASTAADDLKKCVPQGRYAGRVIDVRGGVLYVRLNNGVNAIAHSCYDRRLPGKRDDVSFAVTRLDEEQGVAVGSITRIIKQNL